jgi:hypothetical protein
MTTPHFDSAVPSRWQAAAKFTAIALTALLALTIAVLTLTPMSTSAVSQLSDKLLHAIAFMGLVLPCAVLTPRLLKFVVPFAVTFGAAIEIIQPYVGREPKFLHFVADGVGIGIGVMLGVFLRFVFARWFHGRLRRSAG